MDKVVPEHRLYIPVCWIEIIMHTGIHELFSKNIPVHHTSIPVHVEQFLTIKYPGIPVYVVHCISSVRGTVNIR